MIGFFYIIVCRVNEWRKKTLLNFSGGLISRCLIDAVQFSSLKRSGEVFSEVIGLFVKF